jgi:hypothetical protein
MELVMLQGARYPFAVEIAGGCRAGVRLLREHTEMEERFLDRCALIRRALMPWRTTLYDDRPP